MKQGWVGGIRQALPPSKEQVAKVNEQCDVLE